MVDKSFDKKKRLLKATWNNRRIKGRPEPYISWEAKAS